MDMFMTLFIQMLNNRMPGIGDMGGMVNPDFGGNTPIQSVINDGVVSGNITYDSAVGIISGNLTIENGIVTL